MWYILLLLLLTMITSIITVAVVIFSSLELMACPALTCKAYK